MTIEEWENWFCWHPVKVNGELVWLKHVRRRWNNDAGGIYHAHPTDLYGEPVGAWEYRWPE